MSKIAIVQIRGVLNSQQKIRKTLKHLGLLKKNSCVIMEPTDSLKGMLLVVMDFVTWGEVDETTLESLLTKRGRLAGNTQITDEYATKALKVTLKEFAKNLVNGKNKLKDMPGLKPYFRLTPPKGGLGLGIKTPYSLGGSVGYRKGKINDLIKRML
jgi:large subunit ribosomal protein L30